MAHGGRDDLKDKIADLRKEQSACADQKKKLAKELRNAAKRRARLKRKAKQLNDDDLIAVLRMRHQGMAAAASSAASSSTSGRTPSTPEAGGDALPTPSGDDNPE